MSSDERDIDPISDHSVPADADFSAAGSDEAGPPAANDDSPASDTPDADGSVS